MPGVIVETNGTDQIGSHYSEGSTDGQTDHMQNRTHPEDTYNGRTVPQKADYERHWAFK